MRSLAHNKSKALAVFAAIAVMAGLTTTPAAADPISINLCATTGTATVPGSVPIWGFVSLTGAQTCADVTGTAQIPGPVLEVNTGDVVTVNVTDDLPALPDTSDRIASFELSGLAVTETPLGSGSFEFTASRPGTFVYQSPGDAGRQMAMGLYGALVVRPSGASGTNVRQPCLTAAGNAYDGTLPTDFDAFDRECVLVLSALDPIFNADPDGFNMLDYLATYWLINGAAYPDTDPIEAAEDDKLLLRYVNAGFDNTTMMLLGLHENVIARDAYPLNNPFLADAETLPAGGTEDAIATIPEYSVALTGGTLTDGSLVNGFPLYNRQLHVTNGSSGSTPGGQLTFIVPPPPP